MSRKLSHSLDYRAISGDEGALLVCGGERMAGEHEGYYLKSALFADADDDMRIVRKEIFGPVA